MNEQETEQRKLMQKSIRNFIIRYSKKHGYPPSFREIGEGVYLCSTSSVYAHMKRMRDEGIIDYIDSAPRTITVPGYGFRKL